MTFKKASLAAYGVAAVVAASSMGMQAEAASLSKVLPAAGIGLTLSDGTALSQIKEASTKSANIVTISQLSKMLEINQSVLSKSNLVASSVMKEIFPS